VLDSIAAGGIRENRTGNPPLVERAILEILNEYGSLGYEQIAAHLTEPPDAVRRALEKPARPWPRRCPQCWRA
jgi:hypothetical protein